MRTGNLKYKFTLLLTTYTTNEYNESIPQYTKKTVRGYLKKNSGNKEESNNEVFNSDRITFKIRNHYDIKESDKVKFKNNTYQINNIQEDYNGLYIQINAEKVNK